ncbi:MAG TPA: LytTR family DNA-binding domain-containing protein [Thermoanaerobaculia bacterium]
MRIAIVEDEAVVARRLERMVRALVDASDTIEIAPSRAAARELLRRPLDLLFLDLNLNGRDGFALLEEAAASRFHTVVVSAHHDQALRAFEYGVADFVPKPWSEERLRRALERVRGSEPSPARTLMVRKGRELRAILARDVVYVRGADDYAELHLADGSTHLHEKSLTQLETLLPDEFARVHRSYIANLTQVSAMRNDALVMRDGSVIPVGRVYRATLRARRSAAPPARP